MGRRFPLCALLVTLVAGCGSSSSPPQPVATRPATTVPATPSATPAPPPLPLNDVVGQLFAVGVGGTEITAGLRHLIVDDRVGGVILFRSNFIDAAGLARWSAQLQALGREAHLPAPLLITLDEEGGDVNELDQGISLLPSARSLGARGPARVRTAEAEMARGLRRTGVTVDLAPVADLRTNGGDAVIGDRSYGSDPAAVAPLVAAAVQGLHDGGEAATLKHFPGLGGAPGNPHKAIPTDPVDHATWQRTSAASFRAGIDAGADCVMTTALRVPALDPTGTPAMFSRPVVTGLLRQELGFRGVIVTDSLVMGGLRDEYPVQRGAPAAVRAGNDLVVIAAGPDTVLQENAVLAVRAAVAAGTIPEAQVRESAARVIALRQRSPGGSAALPPSSP
ncbi:MAG: glycoside hydrolase family 3 N-terminal domain-containing protein [Candidatus Dormibacteria bacterium]